MKAHILCVAAIALSVGCGGLAPTREDTGGGWGREWGQKAGVVVFEAANGGFIVVEELNQGIEWKKGDLESLARGDRRPDWLPKTLLCKDRGELLAFLRGYPTLSVDVGSLHDAVASGGELRCVPLDLVEDLGPWLRR